MGKLLPFTDFSVNKDLYRQTDTLITILRSAIGGRVTAGTVPTQTAANGRRFFAVHGNYFGRLTAAAAHTRIGATRYDTRSALFSAASAVVRTDRHAPRHATLPVTSRDAVPVSPRLPLGFPSTTTGRSPDHAGIPIARRWTRATQLRCRAGHRRI